MKHLQQLFKIIFYLLLVPFGAGCSTATSTLWNRKHYHPAADPNLELDFAPRRRDILVSYDELVNSTYFQRSTYWLFASTNALAEHLPAGSIEKTNADNLQLISIFPTETEGKASSPDGYWAVHPRMDPNFVLWYNGRRLQEFKLPDYSKWRRPTVWRVVLTPFSVIYDGVLYIGGIPFYLSQNIPSGSVVF